MSEVKDFGIAMEEIIGELFKEIIACVDTAPEFKRGDKVVITDDNDFGYPKGSKGHIQKMFNDSVTLAGFEGKIPIQFIELAPKKEHDKDYAFFTSSVANVNLKTIAEGLTVEQPIAMVKCGELKEPFLILSRDIIIKAVVIGGDLFPEETLGVHSIADGYIALSVEQLKVDGITVKDIVNEVKRIKNAKWGVPEALVEVSFLNVT